MREIVTSQRPKPDFSYHPCLWFCLSDSSRYALETAYKRATDYHKVLRPPGGSPDLMEFDADAEMKQKPNLSREAMK